MYFYIKIFLIFFFKKIWMLGMEKGSLVLGIVACIMGVIYI